MPKTPNSYILPQGSRCKTAILTTAKASDANLTDAVKIADAGANDSIIKSVWGLPRGTAVDNKLNLYLYDGATVFLIDSVKMAAYTQAVGTATPVTSFTKATFDTPIPFPAGYSLYAGAYVAQASGIAVSAIIEDY